MLSAISKRYRTPMTDDVASIHVAQCIEMKGWSALQFIGVLHGQIV